MTEWVDPNREDLATIRTALLAPSSDPPPTSAVLFELAWQATKRIEMRAYDGAHFREALRERAQARDALAAVRLLRGRALPLAPNEVVRLTFGQYLDTIEAALQPVHALPLPPEPPPRPKTLNELELDVLRSAMETFSARDRFRGIPWRAQDREMVSYHVAHQRACEALSDANHKALTERLHKTGAKT